MAFETVFVGKNIKSTINLGEARGVAILCAANHSIPCFEYAPTKVKQAVVGNGNATKEQVQSMVKRILNLPEIAMKDAADALAVAICHSHSRLIRSKTGI